MTRTITVCLAACIVLAATCTVQSDGVYALRGANVVRLELPTRAYDRSPTAHELLWLFDLTAYEAKI